MERTELVFDFWGAHLEHIFPDGPLETIGLDIVLILI